MTIDQNQTPEGQAVAPTAGAETGVAPDATPTTETTPETVAVEVSPEPETLAPVEDLPVAEAPSETVETASPEAEAAPAVEAIETPAEPVVSEPVLEHTEVVVPETVEATPVVEVPAAVAPVVEAPVVVAPVVVAPVSTVSAVNDMDLFESYMSGDFTVEGDTPEGGFKRLSKGERIEATIIQVDADKVFVDLGTKSEGIIPLGELSEENLETAMGLFNVGDKVNVVVIRPEGAEGNPIVSKKRADFEEIWDRIERAFKTQETLSAVAVDRVKGGLVVDVGVRGFVPATHVGSGKLRNIEKFVGQTLTLKVIEIDRERKKVVLSNRIAEEENRQSAKEQIFTSVKVGDRLQGTVRRLADYGAFVDLGGVDGLLHISEMSWARINHPKEMFKEGQMIDVMVLRLDPENGKISLGHRQVLPDPWNLIRENYKNNQRIMVNVSRIVQSGAFIKLPEGAEAFMPVSEMSIRRIRRPQDVIEEGQEVEVMILDLRPDERRMVLSMKAIGGGSELKPGALEAPSGFEEDLRRSGVGGGAPGGKGRPPAKGARKGGKGRDMDDDGTEEYTGSRRGFGSSGLTIGERLGMLKGMLNRDEDSAEAKPEATAETTEE